MAPPVSKSMRLSAECDKEVASLSHSSSESGQSVNRSSIVTTFVNTPLYSFRFSPNVETSV